MNVSVTQMPCPHCGRPRSEWTENGVTGVERGEVVYCSQACAAQGARTEA